MNAYVATAFVCWLIYKLSCYLFEAKREKDNFKNYPYARLTKMVRDYLHSLPNQEQTRIQIDMIEGKLSWNDIALTVLSEREVKGENIEDYLIYI